MDVIMKTARIITMLAIAAAVMACNKTENLQPSLKSSKFDASFSETVTKVSMGADYSLTWDANDEVTVFDVDGTNGKFVATTSGASTVLEGPEGYQAVPGNTYYAVTPYTPNNKLENGVITTYLPSLMAPKVGMFPDNIAVAKCEDGKTLSFYNVCGLLGIRISRSDIVKVTIASTGENEYLAGRIKVDCSDITNPTYQVVENEACTEVSLVADGVFEPGDYYVALLPQTFSGMTVTMYTSDNLVKTVQSVEGFTLNRSHHIEPLPVDNGAFEQTDPWGLPAIWNFTTTTSNPSFSRAWNIDNSVPSDIGRGRFSYVAVENLNNNFKHDISGGDPRITGAWPGDYWNFQVAYPVNVGSKYKISFTAKVSGTGHKYWMLEYLDGQEWKPAADVLTSTDMGEGNEVEYTHALKNANCLISGSFTAESQMESLQIRFRCVANWKSDGTGALSSRNAGTVRIVHDDPMEIRVQEGLYTEWLFSATAMESSYLSTFGGLKADSEKSNEKGDGGKYIEANVKGTGKITYVQIDKSSLGSDYAARYVGGTGHPTASGAWPGDYWLFEATDGTEYPAGTRVNISYLTRSSDAGHKYWRLEYLDGAEWKPAMQTTSATVNDKTFEYNIMMYPDGKTNVTVNTTVKLTVPTTDFKFRMLCVANDRADGNGPLSSPNAGTCRIAGAEGTSPVIKVVTD